MIRTKKIASTALVSAVVTSGLLFGSSTSAQADGEGNRVIVSGYGSYEHVRSRCFDQQRAYSSMRVRITQSCTYIGQNQNLQYGFAFWWTAA
ncbi:hypothetical protein [Aeromicrobium sp.]|uniref:hypothetical protein n=1 Tax=Aeromicrobium sp. TaxID=1871063 RepID=UPI002FCB08E6